MINFKSKLIIVDVCDLKVAHFRAREIMLLIKENVIAFSELGRIFRQD